MDAKVNKSESENVNLENFAELAGFPLELVKKELFKNKDCKEEVSLEELRSAMLTYLNANMI